MESVVHGHVAALKKLSGDPFPDAKADHWQRFPLQDIEGLRNAVLGADLDAVQMAGRKIGGSLAFSTYDGVILSSGFIAGNAMARVSCRTLPSPSELCSPRSVDFESVCDRPRKERWVFSFRVAKSTSYAHQDRCM